MEFQGKDLTDILTEQQAAARFGRSKFWLARLRKEAVAAGESFPALKIHGRFFYYGRELAAYLNARFRLRPAAPSPMSTTPHPPN